MIGKPNAESGCKGGEAISESELNREVVENRGGLYKGILPKYI